MTICKMRDKPFDVLTKIRAADMTSVDGTTRLVNEREVKSRKEWPTTERDQKMKKNFHSVKQSAKTFIRTATV